MVGWFTGWVFWMWNKFYNMQMIYTIDMMMEKVWVKKSRFRCMPLQYFESSYVE